MIGQSKLLPGFVNCSLCDRFKHNRITVRGGSKLKGRANKFHMVLVDEISVPYL